MKKTITRVSIAIILSTLMPFIEMFSFTQGCTLHNDIQALDYCMTHKNTYVVIVWPKGFDALEYIATQFNQYASVKYIKTMVFKKKSIFLLYRSLHRKMSYKSAKKYFKPYLPKHQRKPLPIAALVIETNAPLKTLLQWKREIRHHIGQRFYSIHINDYYSPETVEAAQAVFCDFNPLDLTDYYT